MESTEFHERTRSTFEQLRTRIDEQWWGGIELELAGCTSVASAAVAAPPTTVTPAPDTPTLPTTGSDDTGTLALAGVVGLAGLGLALLRRSGTSA